MKYIDLFAGIGGFRYGLENVTTSKGNKQRFSKESKSSSINDKGDVATQQFTCVYSNEWDKYASQIYKKHYGECDTRDITKVPAEEIPKPDLICAGFPCQSFSIAGKRKGFSDTRGTLFYEILRIARFHRTPYLLLENVKGLLNHDKGQTFSIILESLDELGYDCQWQVLNSKNFGVPQNRERVFIIGHLRGQSRPKVFPIGSTSRKNKEVELRHKASQQVSPTIRTPKGGHHIPTIRYPLKFIKRNQRKIEGSHSFTVDGANTGGVKEGARIRRLTPTECERLQGFPDGWTEGISDTQRYKCLGNAVTTNVITAIGKELSKGID